MFDRTDVLWREEPTPAPTDKAARGNDQVRQVNDQPDAPGQRPTDAADDRHTYGPPREPPDEHRTARQYRDDPARAELATERHDRELAYAERRVREAGDKQTAIAAPPHDPRTRLADWRLRQMERQDARHPIREDHPEEWTEGLDRPLGKDGQAAFERAQERASHAAQERGPDPPPAEVKAIHMQHARDDQAAWEARRAELTADRDPPGPAGPEDHRQDRQAREDGRTWTEGHAWTDQDRAGIQRFTKDTAAPREDTDDQRVIREYDERNAAREESNRRIDLAAYQRTPYTYTREPRPTHEPREAQPRTDGHRREYDAREAQPRDRRTRATRDRDAIADVGMYRAVSYTDISEQHYDNHPYVTRRAVNRMVRDGKLEEHEATGPQGNTFQVLTATERGRDAAHRAALDAGHVPEQQTWTGLVKPAELSHDTAVYRAALDERARLEADGGRVVRVRLDAELKSLVATATEKARAEGGDRAAETAKAAAAQELGLPMPDGHVMYPDAQLDIEDSQGMGGRVNVEIASDHYHAAAIVAKAGAGFSMHGSSRSANQNIGRALGRAAARETDSGPGGGSGAGRDGSVEL